MIVYCYPFSQLKRATPKDIKVDGIYFQEFESENPGTGSIFVSYDVTIITAVDRYKDIELVGGFTNNPFEEISVDKGQEGRISLVNRTADRGLRQFGISSEEERRSYPVVVNRYHVEEWIIANKVYYGGKLDANKPVEFFR